MVICVSRPITPLSGCKYGNFLYLSSIDARWSFKTAVGYQRAFSDIRLANDFQGSL